MASKKNKAKGKSNCQNNKDVDVGALHESAEKHGINLPDHSHCTWLLNVIQLHACIIAKEEISEQESVIHDQRKRLIKDMQNLREDLESLQQKYAKQHRKLERLEYENKSLKAEVKRVCLKSDELEQENFKNMKILCR